MSYYISVKASSIAEFVADEAPSKTKPSVAKASTTTKPVVTQTPAIAKPVTAEAPAEASTRSLRSRKQN